MAELQEGIQVLFDNIEAGDASSNDTTISDDNGHNVDYHQKMYPSYVPPHKRGHNVQEDEFVNFKTEKAREEDKEGTDNLKYQRLNLPVPFALPRDKLVKLKADFPGVYFHCKDNGNHDHPYSHVTTMIGTRMMQRRIKPGSKVLDVYGNPNACDRFNKSQINADEPKFMKALVNRVGPSDFIREVNKWGPFFDEDVGVERYHRGTLMSMVRSGEISQYDVLHLTHTLYYTPMSEIAEALHAPGKRVAYALIHKHARESGSINDGEQTYTKKVVGGVKLVRQVNTATNSSYVHPDLTDFIFSERKVWMPDSRLACRGVAESIPDRGLTWEVHVINEDTWVVEFVPYIEQELDGVVDYAAMWNDDEFLSSEDYMTSTESSTSSEVHQTATSVLVPTHDGKFIELDIPCKELFEKLRMRCSGRERTSKLLEELISTANHLVAPSTMFGDKIGMRCPPDKIYDVAVAAFTVDVPKETMITEGISCLRPVLNAHARNLRLGPKYKDLSMRDLMSMLRTALSGARTLNSVVRAKDPIDLGLQSIEGML